MRYIFYGAGAVGGTLGALLFESGADVVLIARGDHGRAIAAGGLQFGTPEGWRTLHVPVVAHPSELTLTADDVVVLSMKSNDTTAALTTLAPLADPDVAIVCAQNGVANERRTLRRFANVHGMCVMIPAVHLEPGVVHFHAEPYGGRCDVGRFPLGYDAIDTDLAGALERAGIRSTAHADIMTNKYGKLISNLTNVLEAASGRAALTSDIALSARAEAAHVFAAAGIAVPEAVRPAGPLTIAPVPGVSRPGGSTFQSLARGLGTLETDDINGEIVFIGRLHGIATPVNEMLQRLALKLVADRVAPGSVPVADLERFTNG